MGPLYIMAIKVDFLHNFHFVLLKRLCRMTCEEGRKIVSAVTVQNDKLAVLNCIKR